MQDIRYALRILRRNPGFTAVAVLTLALGIGANTAVFAVVHNVVIQPLRFPDPDRLMAILSTTLGRAGGYTSAPGVFLDWRDRATSFESMAGTSDTGMVLSGSGNARFVPVGRATSNFYGIIGVAPVLGRIYTPADDDNVALLDAGFWKSEFGGRADILGQAITLDETKYTIVGILPAGLRFAHYRTTDVWIPLAPKREYRGGGSVIVVGRLRAGVAPAAAQREMEAVMSGIRAEHQEDSKTGVDVKALHEWIVGDVRRTFFALLGAVVFVLLICCANLANMLIARATVRQKEMAIRACLGASRLRLIRQNLIESIVLALIGGTLGILLANAAVRAVPAIKAFYIPRIDEVTVTNAVLLFAVSITVVSGLLSGLAPALQLARKSPGPALGGTGGGRLRDALVVAQLALALMLLAGAGLMTNSLIRMLRIDVGFERANVITVNMNLPYKKYDRTKGAEFQKRLMAEVRGMPGVELVSASDHLPLQAVLFPYQLQANQRGVIEKCEAMARHVAPQYLSVLGIPLLAGRDLEPADDARHPVPVLINKTLARRLFDTDNPIGRQITTPYRDSKTLEVVGIAGDARQLGLKQEPGPQLYVPLIHGHASYVVARTAPGAPELSSAIRDAVARLDPEVPAPEVSSMDAEFARQIARPSFYLKVLAAFAAMGVILAALGIYGVTAYTVARRTHEFGIRMALGANRADILRLVLGNGARLIVLGSLLGIAGALATTQWLSTLLHEVRPNDPLTLTMVSLLLVSIALLASVVAARKATAVDPSVALRHD